MRAGGAEPSSSLVEGQSLKEMLWNPKFLFRYKNTYRCALNLCVQACIEDRGQQECLPHFLRLASFLMSASPVLRLQPLLKKKKSLVCGWGGRVVLRIHSGARSLRRNILLSSLDTRFIWEFLRTQTFFFPFSLMTQC